MNSAIQSDRGFTYLNYEEALLLSQVYYIFWSSFIAKHNIKLVLHEPTSLFMNHICSLICKKNGSHYICQIMVSADKKHSFLFIKDDNANAVELNYEFDNIDSVQIEVNRSQINSFIQNFRNSESIFLSGIIKTKIPYFKIFLSSIKGKITKLISNLHTHKIKDNIDYWMLHSSFATTRLKNLINYKLNLKYDDFSPDTQYYYYPLHLEPEAVVLYWGDGIYKGQLKLIENIASQLPPETYLYVKDHPHFIGYRSISDYHRLQEIPNVKLIKPEIPGRTVIKNSKGVITINGTAGFEGILLNKPVYVFGNAIYEKSNRVCKIVNVRDLRAALYENNSKTFVDDQELYKFVLAFLRSAHEGVVDYFANRIGKYQIDQAKNAELISLHTISLIKILKDHDIH